MQGNPSKSTHYSALFVPSALGVILYVTLTGLTVGLHQFKNLERYLTIPNGFDLFHTVTKSLDNALTSVIGESKTEIVVVGAFWAVVGLIVYMFLRGLARFVSELDDDIVARRYVWPKGMDRSKPLHVMAERTAFRLVALVLLALVVFGPLAAVLRGPVFSGFFGDSTVVKYIVWAIAGLLVWHLVTVLLRLVALRARLLG